jgi:hypothetical protein
MENKQETHEYSLLQHIKFCLECKNESQAIRLIEQYGFDKQEQDKNKYSEEDMVNFNEWTTIMYPNQRRFLTTSDKRGFYTTKELLTKWFEQFKKK